MPTDRVRELIARGREFASGKPSPTAAMELREDPTFLELRDTIYQLDRARTPKDEELWDKVIGSCSVLLQRLPDAQVASYLCLALFRREGYAGLLTGLSCIRAVFDAFSQSGNGAEPAPKEKSNRKSALAWLGERANRTLKSQQPVAEDAELVAASIESVEGLPLQAFELLSKRDDAWVELKTKLSGLIPQAQSPEMPKIDAVGEASASAAPAESLVDVDAAWKSIRKAALSVWQQDRTAVWPYKVLRLATWSTLAYPKSDKDGCTSIPAPATSTRNDFLASRNGPNWGELLKDAETEFENHPLWLDLQRFSYIALQKLGDEYKLAAQAVRTETRALIDRLPDLLWYKFSDKEKTPFADEETHLWLQQPVEPAASAGERNTPAAKEEQEVSSQDDSRTFEACLGWQEAFDLFLEEGKQRVSGREAFRWRLEFAKYCERAGQIRMAMAQFRALDQETSEHALDRWEPELVTEFLQSWWKLVGAQRGKNLSLEIAKLSDEIYTRLTRIDPVRALSLDRKLQAK